MATIAIRVDASIRMGTGHVMRCLTLANKLKVQNHQVLFLAKQHHGNLNQLIEQQGFKIIQLPVPNINIDQQTDEKQWLGCHYQEDAQACIDALKPYFPLSLVIVDHYGLDKNWQDILKPYCLKLMVIDDLANREHHCDILLDQTFARQKSDYVNLVPKSCKLLLGKKYMLLRDEFSQLRDVAITKRKNFTHSKNLLISMGGTDPDNISQALLQWLITLQPNITKLTVNLIANPCSKHLSKLQQLCQQYAWINLIIKPKSMAELMLDADIAIGSAGATAWERCCLGLPTLTIISAKNQETIATNLSKAGAIINLGWFDKLTKEHFSQALENVLSVDKNYLNLVTNSFKCCHGLGTNNIIKILGDKIINQVSLRLADQKDCELTFQWQSDANLRKYSRNPKAVKKEEHIQWFHKTLKNKKRTLFIITVDNIPCGVLRLDELTEKQQEISILLDANYQGKNIAFQAINIIPLRYRAKNILATVHKDNKASQRLFIRLGFQQISPEQYILKRTLQLKKNYE